MPGKVLLLKTIIIMLETILNLVKENVTSAVAGSPDVASDKQAAVVNTMTQGVTDGLKQNFTLNNMPDLMGLFGKGSSVEGNPVTQNIIGTVATSLIQKVGLPQSVASLLSSKAVPLVMKAISGKVNDPNEKSINVESLIKAFSGGEDNGGLLGKIGKLFQ